MPFTSGATVTVDERPGFAPYTAVLLRPVTRFPADAGAAWFYLTDDGQLSIVFEDECSVRQLVSA